MNDLNDLVTGLSKVALERSVKYNGPDGTNYAYAFGWFVSEMRNNLEDMGLTKKQVKVLQDRLENWNNELV